MKENMRKNRFWTLSRQAGGFTLVELIVVIAILAILAGVGIPVYSGYVTRANKQADMTLIADITSALTLAGYSGTFADGEGGYIILSTEGVEGVEAGSNLEKALIDAFGTNYASVLKLKYNGWGNNGLLNGLTPEMALGVAMSSYMTGGRVDDLLGDVEKMTKMASNLVTALTSGGFAEGTTLSGMFTTSDNVCAMDAAAAKYGISKGEYATWEDWGAVEANKTAYSNLLVLTAAEEAEKMLNGEEVSGASNMILEFSSYYAFAATNPEFSETLDTYLAELESGSITSVNAGKSWYDRLEAEANAAGYADEYASNEDLVLYDNVAFLTILSGLGNPTEEQANIIAADINNINLFTEGAVNGMYNDYLDVVDAMSGMCVGDPDLDSVPVTVGVGEVAIVFTKTSAKLVVGNSLPTA